MSGRGRTTFAKRQKERARKEKQEAKAERRRQRKLAGQSGERPSDAVIEGNEDEGPEEGVSDLESSDSDESSDSEV
jgi:hypothetical protein